VETPELNAPVMPAPADQSIGMVLKRAEQAMVRAKSAALKPAGLTLEEQGLIVRTPHPRHPSVLELHLTDPGREVLDTARHCVEPVEQRITGTFPPEELEVLGALLLRWTEALEGN
jgi:DNA-binding MarR family transcriptional regulator